MPAVLDKQKAKSNKPEAFVEKQIEDARGRIRNLDFLQAALFLMIGTMAFVLVLLLVDRKWETPSGSIWAAIVAFTLAAGGYVWYALFRPSRRHINPFFAARQVEQTIPDAKNSVINYVDLQDDESVPASVRASIGARAAKDMKQVDLSQAIQKKQILYLVAVAALFTVGALIAAFLPATRTTMVLLSPKDGEEVGNVTVVQGQDVVFKVELSGRVPEKGQPDAARVRLWYNAEDPGNFEERVLEPVEGERGIFGHTLPAKQVRNGFFYQVFAGNVKSPVYEVKLRIVPQFTGNWEVEYIYPSYLGKEPDKRSDPNLVGYFNTQVTLTAHANRPVQSAVLEIDGQAQAYQNIPVENDPEAIRFHFPMTRNGRYRIRFVTTEGHKNPDPQWFRISLVDPKPVIRFFDVTYDYPKYLRYDKVSVVLREPKLEVNRGTEVTLVANTNRPIKQAHIQMDGVAKPIMGELVEGQPMQAKFKLGALMKDGAYRVGYQPATDEPAILTPAYSIQIITDEAPKVEITKPEPLIVEVSANGTLGVEGVATDDHGLAKMNLRFEVVAPAPNRALKPMPYRGGISFKRDGDNSYPNRVDYKEVVELAKLKADGPDAAGFTVQAGMEIEYWLEAIDNCDVPPGPNSGTSNKRRIKVMEPEKNPDKKKEQDKEKQNLEQDKKQHEQKQDQKNAEEKRDPNQPKQKNEQPQQGDMGGDPDPNAPKDPNAKVDPKNKGGMGMGMPMMGDMMDPAAEAEQKMREQQLKDLLGKEDPMAKKEPNKEPPVDPKGEPGKKEPGKEEPKATDPKKSEPKMGDPKDNDPKMPEAKKDEKPDPRQLPKPEDVQKLAEKLNSLDKKEHDEAREQIKKNIEQAKNDPRKPEEAQNQLEEHRKKLDEPERKQFDESLERVAKEMKDIQREKRVNDAVDKITKGTPEQKQQGQQELENELRDPQTKEDTERQLQNLAGDMGTERQQQIGDAMNLAKENAKKPPSKSGKPQPPMPKAEEEEDVDKLAKKKQKGTEEEKREAAEQLEKMLRDPTTREKVEKQLEDYKNNIKDKQEREAFEKAMKDIADNANKDKDPDQRRAEEIQKLAEQLKSEDKDKRDAAQKALEESLKQTAKDSKAQKDAEKQLKDARDSIKDPMQKDRFDQAVKDINEAVDKHRQEQAAAQKKLKDEVDDIAKGLNDKDPAKQAEAQKKLEEKLQDPKTRDQVKDELDKLKKSGDAGAKENVEKATEKALDDLNRKEGLEQIVKDLNSKDPDREKAAKENLEDKLADPKNGQQNKKDIDKIKDGLKDQPSKDNVDKAVAEAEKNIAQNKQEAGKLAQDLNSKDKAKQEAAQKKLEEMLKDPVKREQVKNELENLKKNDPQAKENIDKAMEKAKEDIARGQELEKIANDLNSKNPDRQKSAERKLEEKLADDKSREQVKKDLDKVKEGLKNQDAKDRVDDAVEQAEKNIAQNKQEAGKLAEDLTGKDKDKQQAAQDKLENLLKDPAKREQIRKELENIKKGLGDDQAKAKIDDAIKNAENNLTKKDGTGGEAKKEDLDKIANDLNSKDADKEKAAQQQLRDALKDPKTRAKVEKDFNDIKDKRSDAGEKQKLADALNKAKDDLAKLEKPLDPKEIEKLVKDLKGADPKAKEEAQKKLDEMLNDPDMRQKLAKALEELMKDAKGDTAKKDLEDLKEMKDRLTKLDSENPGKTGHVKLPDGKNTGGNTKEPAKEGDSADLKNKVKAGELLLEQFKRNITNEEFRKKLGWTDEQLADFQRKLEQQIADYKRLQEFEAKGEVPPPREVGGGSALNRAGTVKIDPTGGTNPLQGGKYIAPPGFGDPYKNFTENVSGIPGAKK